LIAVAEEVIYDTPPSKWSTNEGEHGKCPHTQIIHLHFKHSYISHRVL